MGGTFFLENGVFSPILAAWFYGVAQFCPFWFFRSRFQRFFPRFQPDLNLVPFLAERTRMIAWIFVLTSLSFRDSSSSRYLPDRFIL